MTPRTLFHADILTNGVKSHLARATLTGQRPRRLHAHDYFEVFWVQNGTVRHHLPSKTVTLREGDLVCMPPDAAHGLQGKGEAALLVSISLHPDVVRGLFNRFPHLPTQVIPDDTPRQYHRDMRALALLNQSALTLEHSSRDALATEAFLLPLMSDLAQSHLGLPAETPEWLRAACASAQDPNVFREGAAGLVQRSGKAHAHVSRTMRRYLNETPSDYINRIRMQHAARQLTTDNEPLAKVAADCGIPNLSHFHRLFRAAHGLTPLKYRQRFQRDVVQPR